VAEAEAEAMFGVGVGAEVELGVGVGGGTVEEGTIDVVVADEGCVAEEKETEAVEEEVAVGEFAVSVVNGLTWECGGRSGMAPLLCGLLCGTTDGDGVDEGEEEADTTEEAEETADTADGCW